MTDDLRSAIRALLRRPAQGALAVFILALGLTTCVAVFTYANGFYQAFPGVDPTGLVRVFAAGEDDPYVDLSYLDYLDYRSGASAFEALAASQVGYAASVRHETMTEVAFLEAVGNDYFAVLGIQAGLGRGLRDEDDRPGAEPVAVLSHAWWLRSFGGRESVLGETLYLNFRPYTIVGVMPPEFVGTTAGLRPDVWIPLAPFSDRYTSWTTASQDRDIPLLRVFGRLRPGVSRAAAEQELQGIASGLDATYPRPQAVRQLRLDPATWIDPRARVAEMPTVRLMVAAAAGLLLLVCANVANLLLALASGRQTELALRSALGATPTRLLRLVLAENLLLSGLAGAIALALAAPVTHRLGSYFARPSVWGANVAREASIDWRVVCFALLVSLATGIAAGLPSAWRASRRQLVGWLQGAASGATGPTGKHGRWFAPQDLLIAVQVALSVVLLVIAGLVLRTFTSVGGIGPGFDHEHLLASYVSTSSTEIQVEGRERFFRELSEELSREPWVTAATIAGSAPLSPHGAGPIGLDGQADPVQATIARVNPGFFEALDVEIVSGRPFEPTDIAGSLDVAMVNAELARRYFPDRDPVGEQLWVAGSPESAQRRYEIVGVTASIRLQELIAAPGPVVYFSYPQQQYPSGSALVVRTAGDPGAAIPQLYRWLREFEPHIAIVNVLPYSEVIRGFLYVQRMNAEMFSAVASIGLALAVVGVFSVMSLAVQRREREIGVRMAIGASRGAIARLVVRRALAPVLIGVIAGLAGAFAVGRLVSSLLSGVTPGDPLTLATGTLMLVAAALAAAWLPARRASRVDPASALRGLR